MKMPIDPKNWEIITDAMADVVNPDRNRAQRALQGVDIAGKTGSAQTISNDLKAKMGANGKAKFKDNGWFVGVTPRRNPEIVVCALLEEGEHGYLAARVVATRSSRPTWRSSAGNRRKVASGTGKTEIGRGMERSRS